MMLIWNFTFAIMSFIEKGIYGSAYRKLVKHIKLVFVDTKKITL
jgi:hypothetical protein